MTKRSEAIMSFARSEKRRIALATLALLVGAACTDQGESTDPATSSSPAARPGAKAAYPPSPEQGRGLLIPRAKRAAGAASGPAKNEPRMQLGQQKRRVAEMRKDRYANLGLSEEQTQRIKAIREEQRAWRAEYGEELRDLSQKRRASRSAGDQAEADAVRLELRELRETLPTERDVIAVLTDEQRAKLRQNRPLNVRGRMPGKQAAAAPAADAEPEPAPE